MNKIIQLHTTLDCHQEKAFRMFVGINEVTSWLASEAIIEPRVGGKYELFWDVRDKRHNSTIGCRINAYEVNKLLAFDWKGPFEFKSVMNNVDPLTQVIVVFRSSINAGCIIESRTDLTLLHTGWRNTDKWDECRLWFEKAWDSAFKKLKSECLNDHSGKMW